MIYDKSFRGASLEGAILNGVSLDRADLSLADLREVSFEDASLRDANLEGADLRWANLKNADLTGASLQFSALPICPESSGFKCSQSLVFDILAMLCSLKCEGDDFALIKKLMLPFAKKSTLAGEIFS